MYEEKNDDAKPKTPDAKEITKKGFGGIISKITSSPKLIVAVSIVEIAIIVGAVLLVGLIGGESNPESSSVPPTQESVINKLKMIPNVVDIEAATEYNDPNGQLNKEDGYIAQIYFSIDVIKQDDVYGITLVEKGTEAGGSIEVYRNQQDAEKRNAYLSTLDGTILSSGSHKVVGTCVVRTSDLLTASLQNILENNLEKMLMGRNDYISMDTYLIEVAKTVATSEYEAIEKLISLGYPNVKSEQIAQLAFINTDTIDATKGLIYEKSSSGTYLEVVGYEGTDVNIVIPNTYKGMPVKSIAPYAFYECKNIESVEMPDNIESVGENAFYSCESLSNVKIGENVTTIGESAFSYCSSISTIIIPNKCITIGEFAFSNCYNIKTLTIGSNVTNIEKGAFYWCSSITEITIPESVIYIGYKAFYNCSSVQRVIINKGIIRIDEYAFCLFAYPVDLYYTGSECDWEQISMDEDSGNFYITGNIHYNYVPNS